jgi:hypothetical protein
VALRDMVSFAAEGEWERFGRTWASLRSLIGIPIVEVMFAVVYCIGKVASTGMDAVVEELICCWVFRSR